MFIINHKKIFITISIILILLSIGSFAYFGFNLSIDFTGGALLEVEYTETRPSQEEALKSLDSLNINNLTIKELGDSGFILRFSDISEENHNNIVNKLKEFSELKELSFEAIGPVIGKELQKSAIWGLILVIIMILLYVAYSFRKLVKNLKSWRFGIIAIIALFHDVIISAGALSVLGYFYGFQLDIPFVAAILTILGYSVNDTIVIFDRVGENMLKGDFKSNNELGGKSIMQTLMRSINTSGTTILVLLSVLFFGPVSLNSFVSILIIGIFIGTYSSIFIALPLLLSKK
ncbi:MAG: protein translocase subunit SecF [Patescibacteria group bacterium]